jgi:Tfp pilus assembly major pilin PilA
MSKKKDEIMTITMEITGSKRQIKEAIAEGWNERTGDTIEAKDMEYVGDKEDIICGIPHMPQSFITIKSVT